MKFQFKYPALTVALFVFVATIAVATYSIRASAAATPAWDPSGQAMPTGDLPGWHQIFADNFANDSYPVGSLTGCNVRGCAGAPSWPWGASPDGWHDTSHNCQYNPSKTTSISGGVLNVWMHTDSTGACMDANLNPLIPAMTYGMYSVRFRADAVPGYKLVDLLWPVNGVNGEIDFPETNLDSVVKGFLHTIAGGSVFQSFKSNVTPTAWHTATLQWTPGRVAFALDGTTLGSTAIAVPQTPMTLAFRAESELNGAPKPPASAQGNLQIDWVSIYSYTGAGTGQPTGGYWLGASDGGIFSFGDAGYHGSTGAIHLNQPIVGMAATPSGLGYWLVARDGGIFSFGDAGYHGSTGAIHLNQPSVGMAATPSGLGYWLVASDGGIFSFGDAGYHGSTGAIHLNQPIVGMAATPSGLGYWLVARDGGIFSFGDAGYHGSTGAIHLNQPIVGMAATPSGLGYWLVASDGGIFSFGDAGYHGSTGAIHLNQPIVGMAATPSGLGYWLVARDGGIFSFGDAGYHGSTGAIHLNQPIVGVAAT